MGKKTPKEMTPATMPMPTDPSIPVTEPIATTGQPLSDHVAWCRFKRQHDKPTRIVLCDSDAEGAFPVYRQWPKTEGDRNSEDKPACSPEYLQEMKEKYGTLMDLPAQHADQPAPVPRGEPTEPIRDCETRWPLSIHDGPLGIIKDNVIYGMSSGSYSMPTKYVKAADSSRDEPATPPAEGKAIMPPGGALDRAIVAEKSLSAAEATIAAIESELDAAGIASETTPREFEEPQEHSVVKRVGWLRQRAASVAGEPKETNS